MTIKKKVLINESTDIQIGKGKSRHLSKSDSIASNNVPKANTDVENLALEFGDESANDDVKRLPIPKHATPVVSTDCMTILFPVSCSRLQEYIIIKFMMLMNMALTLYKSFDKGYTKSQLLRSSSSYDSNFIFPLTDDSALSGNVGKPALRISANPIGDKAFVRVDLMGFPYSNSIILKVRTILEMLFGKDNYLNIFDKARCTRIDIAADFKHVTPDDLVFNKLRSQKGNIFFNKDGSSESIYLGEKKTSSHVLVYSRNAKAKAFNGKIPEQETLRVEYRHKLRSYNFSDLENLEDKFPTIEAYDVQAMIESEYFSPDFIDAITGKGLLPILQKRSDEERKAIKEKMHVFKVHWFKMGTVMKLWRDSSTHLLALHQVVAPELKGEYKIVKKNFIKLRKSVKKPKSSAKKTTKRRVGVSYDL